MTGDDAERMARDAIHDELCGCHKGPDCPRADDYMRGYHAARAAVEAANNLPEKIMAWHGSPTLDHIGTWATTRYPEDAEEYVKVAALPELVKPLEWEKSWAWGLDWWTSEGFEISHSKDQGWWVKGGGITAFSPQSLEAAKAAAQVHYTAQIMAALGIEAAQRDKPVFPAGIEPVDPPATARPLGTWIKCACGVERDTACYCATEGCEYGKGEGSQ